MGYQAEDGKSRYKEIEIRWCNTELRCEVGNEGERVAAGWFDLSFGVRRFRPRCGRVEGKVGVERGRWTRRVR